MRNQVRRNSLFEDINHSSQLRFGLIESRSCQRIFQPSKGSIARKKYKYIYLRLKPVKVILFRYWLIEIRVTHVSFRFGPVEKNQREGAHVQEAGARQSHIKSCTRLVILQSVTQSSDFESWHGRIAETLRYLDSDMNR